MKQETLAQLLDIGIKMAENRNLEPLLQYAMQTAFNLIQAEYGYLVLLGEAGSFNFRVRLDNDGHDVEQPKTPLSYTILNRAIQERRAILIGDARRHPDFLAAKSVLSLRVRSVLCVPLVAHENMLGALYFENRSHENFFSETDLYLLQYFAAQVAISIENATLNDDLEIRVAQRTIELKETIDLLQTEIDERKLLQKKLQETARTDALTQIYNRGHFFELAAYLLKIARRDDLPLTILMIDIDHFKLVNDQCGHLAGDRVLQEIAARLQDNIRSTDILGRYGGEEFVISVPQMVPDSVYYLAERLRLAICSKLITTQKKEIQVTASIGVASWHREDQTLDQLIDKADTALYHAKEAGRNQVAVWKKQERAH